MLSTPHSQLINNLRPSLIQKNQRNHHALLVYFCHVEVIHRAIYDPLYTKYQQNFKDDRLRLVCWNIKSISD